MVSRVRCVVWRQLLQFLWFVNDDSERCMLYHILLYAVLQKDPMILYSTLRVGCTPSGCWSCLVWETRGQS